MSKKDDFLARYQGGKKIKETEYGVRYPDGKVTWFFRGQSFTSISTPEDRAAFKENYEHQVAGLHLKDAPDVTFLRRTVVTSFAGVEVI